MSEFGIGRCPKCYNTGCMWNQGTKRKPGYEYLNNTCYSGLTAKDCGSRIKNKEVGK